MSEETLVGVRIVPGSGLVRAAFFMSGSAFAVSAAGAAKILQSFPCHDGPCLSMPSLQTVRGLCRRHDMPHVCLDPATIARDLLS